VEETNILHSDIITEMEFKKKNGMNLHTFPNFGQSLTGVIEAKLEKKFKRFNHYGTLKQIKDCNYQVDSYEEKLKKQLEDAEKKGFDKGYNLGIQQGIISGKKEIKHLLTELEKTLDEFHCIKSNLAIVAEREAVNLSMAIAKKIIGHEISIGKNVITSVVKEALKKVDGHEKIKIKVHPEDIQILEEHKNEYKKYANCVQGIEILCDENINKGGCIIETNIGDIDARIEKQIKVIEDAFKLES
jgi:flagellar assembly protein FliH